MNKNFSSKILFFTLILSGLIIGMDISSMTIFIGSKKFNEIGNIGTLKQSIISSANPLGGLLGCIIYGIFGGYFGRVQSFRLCSMFWIIGSIIAIVITNIYMIALSRLIKGIAVGSITVLATIYLSEIFPKDIKGFATSVLQLSITIGILITYYVCYFLYKINSEYYYKITWGLEAIPGILIIVISFFIPESPRWLIIQGQYSDAQEILKRLTDIHKKVEDNKIPLLEIYYGSVTKTSYKDLFKRGMWKHTMAAITVQILVQFSGINISMYYIVYICEMIGLENDVKAITSSIPYICNALFTIIPICFLNKMKRKDVIVYGSYLLGIDMLLISITMCLFGKEVSPMNNDPILVWEIKGMPGALVLSLCFLFVSIFSATISCGSWVYSSEILPDRVKSKGMSICMGSSWLTNFILTSISPKLLHTLKWATFLLFGGITLIIVNIILICFPETIELNSENLENLFNKEKNNNLELYVPKGDNFPIDIRSNSSSPKIQVCIPYDNNTKITDF